MNAITLSSQRDAAIIVSPVSHQEASRHVADFHVAYRPVRHFAGRAAFFSINTLIFGRKQHGVSMLREPAPVVFQKIRIEQYALRVLEFEMILYHKGRDRKPGLTRHPEHRFEQVVEADFNVGWGLGGLASAEEDVFTGCFEEVVVNLPGTHG